MKRDFSWKQVPNVLMIAAIAVVVLVFAQQEYARATCWRVGHR
jgi:hypothetical protein